MQPNEEVESLGVEEYLSINVLLLDYQLKIPHLFLKH